MILIDSRLDDDYIVSVIFLVSAWDCDLLAGYDHLFCMVYNRLLLRHRIEHFPFQIEPLAPVDSVPYNIILA